MQDTSGDSDEDDDLYSREKHYFSGEIIKTLLFSTKEKDVYAETVVPKFLYRGDHHRARLEQIPLSGFMVAFTDTPHG